MIKVGIIGGAGYTAGELIRLLINHPDVEIRFINSSSNAGNKITDVHEGLYGETDLVFTDELPLDEIDVLFFCTAHGDTRKFMESHNLPEELKIIDLSMDYRIASEDHDFVYGLPELNRRKICHSKHIANPGCFATCIQLALLPLAKHLMLKGDITVNAITGSTGAGVKPGATTHFSWRNNNLSIYKPFTHQHLPEIRQSLKQLQNSFDADMFRCGYHVHPLPRRFCPRHLCYDHCKDQSGTARNCKDVRRILCRRLVCAYRRKEHRPETSSQHQQVPDSLRETRR